MTTATITPVSPKLLDRLARKRDRLLKDAGGLVERAGDRPLDRNSETMLDGLLDDAAEIDRRLATWKPPEPVVKVKSEPVTYTRHGTASWFRDVAVARFGNEPQARARLARYEQELAVDRPVAELRAALEFEKRVNPNQALGQGGYFMPPVWVIEQWATVPRVARTLSELVKPFDLPDGTGTSINVPRATTGVSVTAQTAGGVNASSTDLADAGITAPVVTLAGMENTALQMLEMVPTPPGWDGVMLADLSSAYDDQLESMLLVGTGSSGQPLGLLNVGSIGSVVYTAASPTGPGIYGPLAQTFATVGNGRKRRPGAWLMRTSRWGWLGAQEDTATRPFLEPAADEPPGPMLATDGTVGPTPAGVFLGTPVLTDDALPVNLGAGTNQDIVVAITPSDLRWWEGPPHFQVSQEVLAGTLQVRFRLHRYVATVLGRYPTGIATLGGTGLVVQSGY